MKKPGLVVLGGLLSFALIATGCSSSPSGGGTGGSGGKGGSGGGGSGGTGGKGGTGGSTDGGTGGGGSGGNTDSGVEHPADSGGDTVTTADTGPCTTSFANGAVQFAFDHGANLGWAGGSSGDVSSTSISIGATVSDGHACPGAASMFVTYGGYTGQTMSLTYNHNTPALNWTGFAKAHFWIKITSADYSGINGVQPYVQSAPNYSNYKGSFTNTSTFTDGAWHEVIVDISASDLPNVVQLGVQVQMKTPADGGTGAAGSFTLLLDDVWTENAPPPEPQPEAGAGDTATGDAATDAASGDATGG